MSVLDYACTMGIYVAWLAWHLDKMDHVRALTGMCVRDVLCSFLIHSEDELATLYSDK